MSFQPVIQLVKVPRDSKSFYFQDNTISYPTNPVGWGAPNAPGSSVAITTIWGENQPYGEEPVPATEVTGLLSGQVQVKVPMPDGVNTIRALYGMHDYLNMQVAEDRLSFTSDSDLGNILDSIVGINIDNSFPVRIKAINGITVELEAPLPGTADTYTEVYKYWPAELRILVINCGESKIVDAIAHLPVRADRCNHSIYILDDILLKISAQITFDCGNFSKAHEAARIICGNQPYVTTPNCQSCG